jgi:hypothetical protein
VKVSRKRKEITDKVLVFVMLCEGSVINLVQKFEENCYVSDNLNGVLDGNESPN